MNKKKLLALLMALVMTLTLVPVTALAEGEPEAKLTHGETTTEYTTAQEALDHAVSGDTVTLYSGNHGTLYLRQNGHVSVGVDVRQQAGEDYSTNDRYRALNGVTIQGNTGATLERIVFEAGAHYGTTHSNPDYSKWLDSFMEIDNLTISGLTFNITGPAALDFGNATNLRITGLNVTNCTVNGTGKFGGAERLLYGVLQSEHLTSKENSTLTGVMKTDVDYTTGLSDLSVTNCTFNNLHQVMEIRNVSGLTFTGNTINRTASHALLCVSDDYNPNSLMGTVTVSGNTVDQVGDRFFRTNKMKDATVTLTNNTITNSGKETRVNGNDASLVAMDNGDNVTYTVSGNSWNGGTDAQTVGNIALFRANPAVVLTPANVAEVVRNSETIGSYTTLQDAIDAAVTGDTVNLLQDITYDADHSVSVWTKAVNLNLNGHTLTTNSGVGKDLSNMGYTASAICYSGIFSATVSNGTIVTAYGAGVYAADGSTITLRDLTIRANTVAPQVTTEYSSAVRVTEESKVIIESGNYNGYNAIAVSSSGGEFDISGGKFQGNLFVSANTAHKQEIVISGGHFTADPTAYLAEGYVKVESTEQGYAYTVQASAVAEVNGTQYTTLAEAFAAANEAGTATIQVLRDCTLDSAVTVNAGSDVTLNLNGKSVTVADNENTRHDIEVTSYANGTNLTNQNACGYAVIQNSGTLKITGAGTIDGSAIASGTDFIYNKDTNPTPKTMYLINNDGEITIENGTFKMYPAIKSVVLRSKGTANLKGGSFSAWSAVLNDDGGVMTVDGGTYRGWAYSGNAAGYRYAFAQYGTDSQLTINDGDFKGVHGTLGVSVGHTTVNDGTFKTRSVSLARADSNEEVPESLPNNAATFYTVYAAGERGVVDITINGGNFSNAGDSAVLWIGNDNTSGDGGINAAASATITGGTFTQDNDKGVFYVAQNTGGASITGGTYVGAKFNGTSYVANGYSAYQTAVDGKTYTYKIGVVKENQVNQTSATENLQVYTGSKKVYESQNSENPIANLTSITVNVKPGTTDDVNKDAATKAPAALDNVTGDAMTSIVKAAVDKAPNENGDQTIEVTIQVAKSKGTITDNKAVYEVHPEAVIKTGTTVLGTVRLSNDEIQNEFSFKLEVTGAGFSDDQEVLVTNTHANGTSDVYGPFTVTTEGSKQIVNVTGVTKFSEVVVTPASDGTVSFKGASLRRRVRTGTDNVVNTSSDIRFTYEWTNPENQTLVTGPDKSYFEWRVAGQSEWKRVNIEHYDGNYASLVIEGVPRAAFDTVIETRVHLQFTGEYEIDLQGSSRTVKQVATALAGLTDTHAEWIDYGKFLLGTYDIESYTLERSGESITGYHTNLSGN